MLHIDVITIFPEVFGAYLSESILGKAIDKDAFRVTLHNLRDFSTDKHRKVDDYPYGGGPGMVMKPEPFEATLEHIAKDGMPTRVVLMSPQGRPFTQGLAEEYSREQKRIVLLCGRYEGIDERVRLMLVDEEVSVGDYVLTGGELPALVIIDATLRLLPGVVGDDRSLVDESFSWGILDYPHYTRPPQWRGLAVPEVLTQGNHKLIEGYRRKEALRRTLVNRPDLLGKARLSDIDKKLLLDIKKEETNESGQGS